MSSLAADTAEADFAVCGFPRTGRVAGPARAGHIAAGPPCSPCQEIGRRKILRPKARNAREEEPAFVIGNRNRGAVVRAPVILEKDAAVFEHAESVVAAAPQDRLGTTEAIPGLSSRTDGL